MDAGEIIWHILAIIGAIKLACWLIPFLYWSLFCCINLSNYKYGYVLITGASDGIGKALTKEFARRGHKVLMLSRNREKLLSVKSEILSIYPDAELEIIVSDLSSSHKNPAAFYENLFIELEKFNISILVNNVGTADFHTLNHESFSSIESMISLNIYPSTFLTHKLISSFLDRFRETKQRSLIVNFSSTAEENLFPGGAVYSATKRFNAYFSEGLRYEYDEIDVATVKPGGVTTNLLTSNEAEFLPLQTDPDSYAKALLGGLRTGVNHGHWKHKIFGNAIDIWPYLISAIIVRLFLPLAAKKGMIR